ncbi:MAG TPA: stalk domain-containing protein [Sedimentibacter sp.]|nr:stalk domain-containing protein [Sedimentibacter sp.]HOW23917.1 stalk domain-containing protein [Sedimentibacter sp.]
MKTLKTVLTALLILALFFVPDVYGLTFEASNHYELKNIIAEQLKEYNPEFNIKYTGSLDNIEEILEETVKSDIYLSSVVKRIDWNISGTKNPSNINVKVSYIMTREERIEADKIIDEILKNIITPYMNDHEKVKAVHDYIVLNSRYDRNSVYYSDYDLLTRGTSVCNGYALLTYNMLNKLNIPIKLVSGIAGGEAHIWNMVKLGDYWFHLDVTWDDPVSARDSVYYTYYMLSEKEISKDHTIDKDINLPKATKNYYDYLKELSYEKLLVETGLNMYDEENFAKDEAQLKAILTTKITCRPLMISVRFDKSISQDSIIDAMSQLYKYDYISVINYNQSDYDIKGEGKILNLFITYNETPDDIVAEFAKKVYNTASEVKYNVYALYGNKKVDITKDVYIYPYDSNKLTVNKGTLRFKEPGNYNLLFEYQGLDKKVSITGLNAEAFNYITDKKQENYVNVKVYDQYIDFSSVNQWPVIEEGRTMVPLRAVFEVLNCKVRWEESSKSAIVEHGTTKIIIPANSTTAYVNGKPYSLDVPAKIINDRVLIPLRFVSEAIEKTVIWDDLNKTVLIY